MRSSLLALAFLVLVASPVAAQLVGNDTAPGDSCADKPVGATRITADPDGNGSDVTLICDGSTWNTAGVKVYDDPAACDASKDGTIRYISTGDPPWEYCDGGASAWVNFKQPRCEDDDTGECYLDVTRDNDDPEFLAANIKDGVNILGVTGTSTGCTPDPACPNVGDVCSGDSSGNGNPKFAGCICYYDTNSFDVGSCKAIYTAQDSQTSSQWKTSVGSDDIVTDSTEDGKINDNEVADSSTFPAFKSCKDLTDGGYTDWYLPARTELDLLWRNSATIGDFQISSYWSSTESSTDNAWYQFFGNGGQGSDVKTSINYYVHCIRRDGPCTGGAPPAIGETCSDGTIYAGLSPDGDVAMYTTPSDQSSGAYWGTFAFITGSTSAVTGEANTADVYAHVQAGDGSYNPDDGDTPNAFVLCAELSAHGYDDWYLPAEDELNVLYTNKNAGDLDGTFTESGSSQARFYWSSSESGDLNARDQKFSDGSRFDGFKQGTLSVRCVRR